MAELIDLSVNDASNTARFRERLLELLKYDAETGIFTWQVHANNKGAAIGMRAGQQRRHGYRAVNLDKQRFYEHRLAWLYVHGKWPKGVIDHINGDRADNRITNLRDATVSQNLSNRGAPSHNKSGFKGVSKFRKRWAAEIQKSGKRMRLGFFDTPEEAATAYAAAAKIVHGEYARVK